MMIHMRIWRGERRGYRGGERECPRVVEVGIVTFTGEISVVILGVIETV
jgi:hypothetical protein